MPTTIPRWGQVGVKILYLSPSLTCPILKRTYSGGNYPLTGGVYHSVSEKHLQDYVNEYAFRYNHRDDAQAMFSTISKRAKKVRSGKHGEYSPVGKSKG